MQATQNDVQIKGAFKQFGSSVVLNARGEDL